MPKKIERGDPLVSPGMVCYAEKQEKPFWFCSLDQIVQFCAIIFCRTFKNYFGQFVRIEKKSHYNSRVSLHEAPTKKVDASCYIQILKDHALNFPTRQRKTTSQPTVPKNANFFEENAFVCLENWPPQSPDLNVIGNLWSVLKKAVYRRNPRNLDELLFFSQEEFAKIPKAYVQKLYDSNPSRLTLVLQNIGYHKILKCKQCFLYFTLFMYLVSVLSNCFLKNSKSSHYVAFNNIHYCTELAYETSFWKIL